VPTQQPLEDSLARKLGNLGSATRELGIPSSH